jgi:hypothetical protein
MNRRGSLHLRTAVFVILAMATATAVLAQNRITPAPVFNPAGGNYTTALSVEITDSDEGAVIYYTTDGTTPTANSPLYTYPITVGLGITKIQAYAVEITAGVAPSGPSAVVSATYDVAPANATVTLTATPNPLVLPGSLQLKAVVNLKPSGGAVPSGTVAFVSDSTKTLGTASLKIIPSTQAWT